MNTNSKPAVVFVLVIVILAICGGLLLMAGGDYLTAMVKAQLLEAEAAMLRGRADMETAQADRFRAEGELELKKAEIFAYWLE